MIHIVGYNISPFLGNEPELVSICRGDPKRLEHNRLWREKLRDILERISQKYPILAKEETLCFFGHDPSVPTAPYPIAVLIVRVPTNVNAGRHIHHDYAVDLGQALERRLNQMRDTDEAQVRVEIDVIDNERYCYSTPLK